MGFMIKMKKGKSEKNLVDPSQNMRESIFKEESIKKLVAPEGVNPNPLGHMVLSDKGKEIYIRNFYIDKMPRRSQFASTFASVFSFEDSTLSVFIDPLLEGKAIRHLDKRVLELETETRAAIKAGDTNRERKMSAKLRKTEGWATNIESGTNALFEVSFLFTLYADSLEKLGLKTSDFVARARERGLDMVATYAVHPEAYLSNGPFNKLFDAGEGLIHVPNIKKHIMDRNGLSAIYSHTSSSFSHVNGVPLGRNMKTGEPITYDIYDRSHQGYGIVISGKTGTGKSAMIKILTSRFIPFGYRVASIDSDKKGNRGEYSMTAERLGGVNFQIKSNSKNIINLFEIDIQEEYDEVTDTEFKTLRLLDKISDITNIIMTMIKGQKSDPDFTLGTYLERIVMDAVTELYAERGIVENEIESIYTTGEVIKAGRLVTGKSKKKLPILSDFYIKVHELQRRDKDNFHKEAYSLVLDVMKDYVKEMYYDEVTLQRFSKEEYEKLISKDVPVNIVRLLGTKGFYDGQSTVSVSKNTPFVNIDISDLPKVDQPVAQQIALNFLNENFIKKNSENPKKTGKMIVIIDECHRMFPYENARKFISDVYRTARKRNVSPWTCTQALVDFKGYKETESIVANSTSVFLFKQSSQDKAYLKDKTVLTESQIDDVLALGGDPNDIENKEHKGEVCLIDNDRAVFIKVDYLFATEAVIVETDMSKVKEMYR